MSNSLEKDLEALLKDARKQAESKRQKPGQGTPQAARLAWTDPVNWPLTGHVQLVHKERRMEGEVQTLLGLFEERIHASGARRLVACQLDSTMKPRIEYVTGDIWITHGSLEAKRRAPDQIIEVCEDLILACGPAAPAVVVSCRIVSGGVASILLSRDTLFESFTPRTFMQLPAGMDVLEGLSRDTKERVWTEVKTQLAE